MFDLNDTITAISSPTADKRTIIRISGLAVAEILKKIFRSDKNSTKTGIYSGKALIENGLEIPASLYLFISPHSYTAEDLAEIHFYANASITEAYMKKILSLKTRLAGPGEFTARAYLNGKIDLAQAEAVCEIITGSNSFQVNAAQKLLSGKLSQKTLSINQKLLETLSLIEASLDFASEDIEFSSKENILEKLADTKNLLEELLNESISYETIIDLPSVGIAGAPNAGKSSLLNKLLEQKRSIVSEKIKTTRDVLTGELLLKNSRCILFDCAGLLLNPKNIIDNLAQQAAIEALSSAKIVLFCIDITKNNFDNDLKIRKLIHCRKIIYVAAKSDLIEKNKVLEKLSKINRLFSADFIPVSSKTAANLNMLKETIDSELLGKTSSLAPEQQDSFVAMNARHCHCVTESIENISTAAEKIKDGDDEIASMLIRSAMQSLGDIEYQLVDEKILDHIFSRFCIGK